MEALTNRILPSLPQTVKIFAKISILSDISQVLLSAPACALLQGSWNRSSSCSSWNRSSSSFFGDSALLCALRDLCDEILPLLLRPGNSALPSCSRLRPASGFVESLFFVFLRFLRGIAFLRLPPVPSVIPLFSAVKSNLLRLSPSPPPARSAPVPPGQAGSPSSRPGAPSDRPSRTAPAPPAAPLSTRRPSTSTNRPP
jgi:hypothetical protein